VLVAAQVARDQADDERGDSERSGEPAPRGAPREQAPPGAAQLQNVAVSVSTHPATIGRPAEPAAVIFEGQAGVG